ncbi:hypothetical protein, partial [[Flexibacter] sp. ATCC 35208]|uniref:hypothetical protein n=1 Tax=[Flexibacter] sp. ATCC 35208 TaxID=1936242 RepID=UPI0009C4A884
CKQLHYLIDWKNQTQTDFYNVSGKKDLLKRLKDILDDQDEKNHELTGVWNGTYSTDIFKIPIAKWHFELNQYFNY